MITSIGSPKLIRRPSLSSTSAINPIMEFAISPCHKYISAIFSYEITIFSNSYLRVPLTHVSQPSDFHHYGPHKSLVWSPDSTHLYVSTYEGSHLFVYNFHTETQGKENGVGASTEDSDGLEEGKNYAPMLLKRHTGVKFATLELERIISLKAACHSLATSDTHVAAACSKQMVLLIINVRTRSVTGVVDIFELFTPFVRKPKEGEGASFIHLNNRKEGTVGSGYASSYNLNAMSAHLTAENGATSIIEYLQATRTDGEIGVRYDEPVVANRLNVVGEEQKRDMETGSRRWSEMDAAYLKAQSAFDLSRLGILKIALDLSLDMVSCILGNGAAVLLGWRKGIQANSNTEEGAKHGMVEETTCMGILVRTEGVVQMEVNSLKQIVAVALKNGTIELIAINPVELCDNVVVAAYVVDMTEVWAPNCSMKDFGEVQALSWSRDGSALASGWSKCGMAVFSHTGKLLFAPLHPPDGAGSSVTMKQKQKRNERTTKILRLRNSGVFSLSWAAYDLSILVCYRKCTEFIVEFPVYRSASLGVGVSAIDGFGQRFASDASKRMLIGSDTIYLCRRSSWSPHSFRWSSIPYSSQSYVNRNWPIRQAVLNSSGEYLLISGLNGASVCRLSDQRWRPFESINDEMQLRVKYLPIGWYSESIFFICHQRMPLDGSATAESSAAAAEVEAVERRWDQSNRHSLFSSLVNNTSVASRFSISFFNVEERLRLDKAVATISLYYAFPLRCAVLSDENKMVLPYDEQPCTTFCGNKNDSYRTCHMKQCGVGTREQLRKTQCFASPILAIYDSKIFLTAYKLTAKEKDHRERVYSIEMLWRVDLKVLQWEEHPLEIRFCGYQLHLLVTHRNQSVTSVHLIQTGSTWSARESPVLFKNAKSLWCDSAAQLNTFFTIPCTVKYSTAEDATSSIEIEERDVCFVDNIMTLPLSTESTQIPTTQEELLDGEKTHEDSSNGVVGTSKKLINEHSRETDVADSSALREADAAFFKHTRDLIKKQQTDRKRPEVDKQKSLMGGTYVWCQTERGLEISCVSFYCETYDSSTLHGNGRCATKDVTAVYQTYTIAKIETNYNPIHIIAIAAKDGIAISSSPSNVFTGGSPFPHIQLLLQPQLCGHQLLKLIVPYKCEDTTCKDDQTLQKQKNVPPLFRQFETSPYFMSLLKLLLHYLLEEAINSYKLACKALQRIDDYIVVEDVDSTSRLYYTFECTFVKACMNEYEAEGTPPTSCIEEYASSLHQTTTDPSQLLLLLTKGAKQTYALQLCCAKSTAFQDLHHGISILEQFGLLEETMISAIRTSDPFVSPVVAFAASGLHPHSLFFQCIEEGRVRTASLYLLLLQSSVGPLEVRERYVLPLLKKSLEADCLSLSRDLIRFFKALYSPIVEDEEDIEIRQEEVSLCKEGEEADGEKQENTSGVVSYDDSPYLSDEISEPSDEDGSTLYQVVQPNWEYVSNEASRGLSVYKNLKSLAFKEGNAVYAFGKIDEYLFWSTSKSFKRRLLEPASGLWRPCTLDQNVNAPIVMVGDTLDIEAAHMVYLKMEETVEAVVCHLMTNLQLLRLYNLAFILQIDLPAWLHRKREHFLQQFCIRLPDEEAPTDKRECTSSEIRDTVNDKTASNGSKPTVGTPNYNNQEVTFSLEELFTFFQYNFQTATRIAILPNIPGIINARSRFFKAAKKVADNGDETLCVSSTYSDTILRYFLRLFLIMRLPLPALAIALAVRDSTLCNILLEANTPIRQQLLCMVTESESNRQFIALLRNLLQAEDDRLEVVEY